MLGHSGTTTESVPPRLQAVLQSLVRTVRMDVGREQLARPCLARAGCTIPA